VRNIKRTAMASPFTIVFPAAQRAIACASMRTIRLFKPVEKLLDVDRGTREASRTRTLPVITRRRFNPEKKAWLPILYTHRGDRTTRLYSRTQQRAIRLRTTHDWVIIYQDGQFRAATLHVGYLPSRSSRRAADRPRRRWPRSISPSTSRLVIQGQARARVRLCVLESR
jgi:hypothetical protein